MKNVAEITQKAMDKFAKLTGREYQSLNMPVHPMRNASSF